MFDFPGGQAAAFCITYAVGTAGYFLFRLLRVPIPGLLGSMAATGALNVMGLFPTFNTRLVSFVSSVIIGVMIGRQIDRTVFRRMADIAKPVLFQTVGMLVLSFVCGLTMRLVSEVDLATSLISATAGGLTEMIIFGMSLDADISVIAFVQVFRFVLFVLLVPYLVMVAGKITGVPTSHGLNACEKEVIVEFFGRRDYLFMVPMAFAGGALAFHMKVPAGAMLGAMFAAGGFALLLCKRYKLDSRLRIAAQIGLGLVTGQRITHQLVERLGTLFVPTLATTMIMMAGCTLMAFLLCKTLKWSLMTCLLCTAPAGLSQIAVIAEDIGTDPLTVSVFHTARIVGIVTFYPWLILPFIS